jgi:hypothetical protein
LAVRLMSDYGLSYVLRGLAWLGRVPRLAVRVLEDNPDKPVGYLRFEVENRSASITSLTPIVRCRFFFPAKGRMVKGRAEYHVREVERQLQPYRPQIFEATADTLSGAYQFSWFRTYVFSPTRGLATKVRVRNCFLEPLGMARFTYEWLLFRVCGVVKDHGPMSIDDYSKMKRSQGPH